MIESILLLVLMGGIILAIEIMRKRGPTFDVLFFFNASFLVYYVLAPLHLLIGGQGFATLPNIYRDYFGYQAYTFIFFVCLLSFLAYGATLFGFYAVGSAGKNTAYLLRPVSNRVVKNLAISALVIGGISLFLYLRQFDSFLTAFLQAAIIKSGDVSDAGAMAFLRNLIPLVAIAAPLFLVLRLRQEVAGESRRYAVLIIFLISLGIVALITQASRRSFMIYMLEFYFLIANVRARMYWRQMLLLGSVVFVLIIFGDVFSLGAALGEDFLLKGLRELIAQNGIEVYSTVWRDFTYTFQSLIAVVDRYNGFPRLFIDIPLAFWDLLPQRLLALPAPDSLAIESTLLITEIPVPLIAEVPPGYIGFLWYSGYLPGVVVGGFAFGAFGRITHNFLIPVAQRDPAAMLVYTYAAFCYGYFLREGVLAMILTERFHWFFIGVVLVAMMLRPKAKTPIDLQPA